MTAAPVLPDLSALLVGEPPVVVQRLLVLTCKQLGTDLAVVSVMDGAGHRTVRQAAYAGGDNGRAEPHGPAGARSASVPYAEAPLADDDGTVFGALGTVGRPGQTSLDGRGRELLARLAQVLAPLVRALDAPGPPPPVVDLAAVAAVVSDADDVERLSRPLLEALHELTGLASAYLTVVHEGDGVQEVRYARNTREGFEIPEGIVVPWADTLCKRALDEGRACTTEVPEVWGDSTAAAALGIQVYVSVPVVTSDGQVWGTLCAADAVAAEAVEAHLPTMRLFARLIGSEVEREAAVHRAQAEAETDALTRCASRRAVEPWLTRQLGSLAEDEVVAVAFADLDDFKRVNDTLGHAAGDEVLVQVGRRLRAVARPYDLVARLGGDEFLVATRLPRAAATTVTDRVPDALTFAMPWRDTTVQIQTSVGVAVSDGHDAASLVAAADAAMYAVKRARRT